MKQKLTVIFEWLSKHWKLLSSILFPTLIFVFTFIKPYLLISVCIPLIWFIPIIIIPIFITFYIKHLFERSTKRLFKKGDAVMFKGGSKVMYILSYDFLSNTSVICVDKENNKLTLPQTALSIFQSTASMGLHSGSYRNRDYI